MDEFSVYKMYIALKLHFTTDAYDVIKQKGRVRASRQAFAKRTDLFSIRKINISYNAIIFNLIRIFIKSYDLISK